MSLCVTHELINSNTQTQTGHFAFISYRRLFTTLKTNNNTTAPMLDLDYFMYERPSFRDKMILVLVRVCICLCVCLCLWLSVFLLFISAFTVPIQTIQAIFL